MTTATDIRVYRGPAVLSYGFRPFFLAGAGWAAVAVALWLPMLAGRLSLPTAFVPMEWHAHELIYGYVPAVVAGFLLTAVPNWTGRLPVVGARLLALFVVWVAGRVAVMVSSMIGPGIAAIIDLSFLAFLGSVIAREILAGRDLRNLKVLLLVVLLFAGNALFHFEASHRSGTHFGMRTGIAATVLLIMLIGGRIIPSFTRNWLAKREAGRLPEPFGRFDVAVMILSGTALAFWTVAPGHGLTAFATAFAAVFNGWRLVRWAGERTTEEPLVLILHVAFLFIPVGFALVAIGIARPDVVTQSGALHAWTAGAIGLMTLAVMTRASLGHTGRPLKATPAIHALYLGALVAVVSRIIAAFDFMREPMLYLSATAWVVAFAGFVLVYAPLLLRSRS